MKIFSDQTRYLVVMDREGGIAGVPTRIGLIKGVNVEAPPGDGP